MTRTTVRLRTAGAAAGVAAALTFPGAAPASAGPPMSGSGTGIITSVTPSPVREAGGNRIEERVLTGVLQGTLTGTFVEEVRGVVHRNGQVTFHGTLTFTGTAEGCGAGTVTARLTGRGAAGAAPVTDATFHTVRQSGNDLGVTGGGTVSQNGPFLEYDLRYTCR